MKCPARGVGIDVSSDRCLRLRDASGEPDRPLDVAGVPLVQLVMALLFVFSPPDDTSSM